MERLPMSKTSGLKGKSMEPLRDKACGQEWENYEINDLCDEDLFYWMKRDDEENLEHLSYLGAPFPSGCRFCI